MIYAILFLVLAIACYSLSQLQQQGNLKNQPDNKSFWGVFSWMRKYKEWPIDKRPAFFGSTTFLVFLTDSYHALQAISFLFLSLSFGFLMGNHWYSLGAWLVIHATHYTIYRLLSKTK